MKTVPKKPHWWVRLRKHVQEVVAAVRMPVHDDVAFNAEWNAQVEPNGICDQDRANEVIRELEKLIERSTVSINNTYIKAQIVTGISGGLIVAYLSVVGSLPGVRWPVLIIAVVMTTLALGLLQLITTPRRNIWKQKISTPGVYAIRLTLRTKALSLSRRAMHNRAVLLGNRRIAWLCTWMLILPGLALAMASWVPLYVLIGLSLVVLLTGLYRRAIGGGRPSGPTVYPSL